MSIEKRITQIIEDTGHSARARVIIEEIITPLCKDAFESGEEYKEKVKSLSWEEAVEFEQWKQQNLK